MSRTIVELWQAAVTDHREHVALAHGDDRRTYGELDDAIRARAAGWRALGLQIGDRVALLEENTAAYLEVYFAAALAGLVLVPLNHRLSVRELRGILGDAGAALLLFSARFSDAAQALSGDVRTFALSEAPQATTGFEPARPAPDDLAQLYYTSGTTGQPKGVMLTHANVCAHAAAVIDELELVREDRWGHFAPLFHLADAWATFAITAVGGVHVFAPRFEPGEALARIESEGVTLTNLVPTMLAAMVAHPNAASFDPGSLRMILSGGAPIAPSTVRRVIAVFRCEYVQTYGMTETSPYLTLSLLHDHLRELDEERQLHYRARTGRPFAAVELEVVDGEGRPVPPDDRTVGEIRVRGATVSPGYWRRPEETAAAQRHGWLYTGDLAVLDTEGYVNIVDRRKDMIVTGGENVYSTEVENVLQEHPAVREVAVYGRPDERWGEAVLAAVSLRAPVEPEELRGFCRERLAGFKVPREIRVLAELPKTGSGKIAKARLRDPDAR